MLLSCGERLESSSPLLLFLFFTTAEILLVLLLVLLLGSLSYGTAVTLITYPLPACHFIPSTSSHGILQLRPWKCHQVSGDGKLSHFMNKLLDS